MEKVKLPREVAELMVNIKRDILIDIPYMQRMALGEYPDTEQLSPIYDWYLDNKEDYFKALIIGYEVEQTPEDKVRELYDMFESFGIGEEKRVLIREILKAYGHKVKGVND